MLPVLPLDTIEWAHCIYLHHLLRSRIEPYPMNRVLLAGVFLLLGLISIGCGNSPQAEPETVYTDSAALTRGMALMIPPVEAQWVEYPLGVSTVDIGPRDLALLAVMRFDDEGIASLTEQMTEPHQPVSVEPAFIREWFPADIKNAFTLNESTGRAEVNVPVFRPTPFITGSYRDGYAFIVGEYVLLYMQTT
jgi:hypothetical protein